MKTHLNPKAFTIMEIMVVMIILGAVAAYAIPNYVRSVRQSHQSDAIMQLSAIHSANQIYRARSGDYWPNTGGSFNIGDINTNLSLEIIPNNMTYTCSGDGATFTCNAVFGGSNPFTVQVTEAALSDTNPDCISGAACP